MKRLSPYFWAKNDPTFDTKKFYTKKVEGYRVHLYLREPRIY